MSRALARPALGSALFGMVLLSGASSRAQPLPLSTALAAPQEETTGTDTTEARADTEASSEAETDVAPATEGQEPIPESPPLSTYDRMRQQNNEPLEEERSLTSQLIRTVFALAIVVGLIYLVFKLGLGRLLQGGGVTALRGKASREIKVLERTMLDGKNAVVMLELAGDRRILVGAGERGVSYLCEVEPGPREPPPNESPSSRTFSQVLNANTEDEHEA